MKKRYKLFIIIVISFLMVIFLYYFFYNKNNKDLFSLKETNNNFSYDDFFKNEYNIYKYQKDNIILDSLVSEFKNDTIGDYIKKSKIIILNFGTSELNNYYKLNEEILLDYLNNAYIIFETVRSINKNKIVFINFYDENYSFVNKKLYHYCKTFNINYVDGNIFNYYLYSLNNKTYLTYEGEKKLYNYIVNN